MLSSPIRILALAVLLLGLLVALGGEVHALQSTTGLDLVSPATCPVGGCAAGQQLDFTVNYSLSKMDPNRLPNVQVCVFAPVNWSAEKFTFSPLGSLSNRTYNYSISQCNPAPNGYYPTGGAIAGLPAGSFGDSFSFSFRLGTTATDPGSVLVEIFEKDTTGTWVSTNQALHALTVAPVSATVFVANDAATCAGNTPCYVNSLADQTGGLGTGLKDAIDAAPSPASLTLLGTYTIKQNAVDINQPHSIKGNGATRLTYSGTVCNQAMLQIRAGAVLTGLAIDDGNCSGTTNRDLITVESTGAVRIENNDLMGGNNAIHALAGNTAAITVTGNHINGNAAYAILLESANSGVLNAFANNLAGNRSGVQVECHGAAKGTVDHNYWGAGVLATAGSSQCTAVNTKRLGAPILRNSGYPGTQANLVTVNSTTQYAFNNKIGFQRTGSGSDFGLVIVNHGQGGAENVPFSSGQLGSFNACSSYWDVFLNEAAPTGEATLELYFKYNLSAACVATIQSTQYCGQITNASAYPLWWYDLTSNDWKTTGTGGSPTYCRPGTQELQVSIEAGAVGRPGFADLAHQPFVVGLPGQSALVTLTSFTSQPGDKLATLTWNTTNEISVAGFYIQRSTSATSGFNTISSLQVRQGTNGGGANYQYVATGLTNNTQYYFRLLIVGLDGRSTEIGNTSTTPFPATPTATLTATISPVIPTLTRTSTIRPTSTFTFRTSTRTPTLTRTPTSPFQTVTITGTTTATSLTRTITPTRKLSPAYPVPTTQEASTALAATRAARTEIALLSATPTPTPTPEEGDRPPSPLTIMMAILAVTALAGGAFFLFQEQRLSR